MPAAAAVSVFLHALDAEARDSVLKRIRQYSVTTQRDRVCERGRVRLCCTV